MNYLLKITKIFLSLILTLMGCFLMISFSMDDKMDQGLSERSKILYGFIGKTGRAIGKKYDMSLGGIGLGREGDKIDLMSLSFKKYGNFLTEQAARKLIMCCANDFLKAVNNDIEVKPFLADDPFTAKNLDLAIHNCDHSGYAVTDPFIVSVNISRGEIGYFTLDKPDSLQYKSKKYELFDEAVATLKKENQTQN